MGNFPQRHLEVKFYLPFWHSIRQVCQAINLLPNETCQVFNIIAIIYFLGYYSWHDWYG